MSVEFEVIDLSGSRPDNIVDFPVVQYDEPTEEEPEQTVLSQLMQAVQDRVPGYVIILVDPISYKPTWQANQAWYEHEYGPEHTHNMLTTLRGVLQAIDQTVVPQLPA